MNRLLMLGAPGTGFNQGTAPLCINPAGVIMGLYIDTKYGHHGFLRIPTHQDDDTDDTEGFGGSD
jgi:hypothetical protein